MTQRWASVAELGPGRSLDWGGTWSGNTPGSRREDQLDSRAFWAVLGWTRENRCEWRQVDWGAWALKVDGPMLRQFLVETYGAESIEAAVTGSALRTSLDWIDRLKPGEMVAIVAAEL
jgi:hypothetical protein